MLAEIIVVKVIEVVTHVLTFPANISCQIAPGNLGMYFLTAKNISELLFQTWFMTNASG